MSNVLERLTEGSVERNMLKETEAVVSKWEKSGLLEGVKNARQKATMAVLLENQAKELLKEANTMASGDVQGFAAVAFPIVRRVFAGLIANDLVSVQPMSLPSGLVFFMDFKRASNVGNIDPTDVTKGDAAFSSGSSFFGDRLGVQITGGVRVDGVDNAEKGYYNLGSGYNKARYYSNVTASNVYVVTASTVSGLDAAGQKLIRFDQDILNDSVYDRVAVVQIPLTAAAVGAELASLLAEQDVFSVSLANLSSAVTSGVGDYTGANLTTTSHKVIRRLARVLPSGSATGDVKTLELVVVRNGTWTLNGAGTRFAEAQNFALSLPVKDKLDNVGVNALGATFATNPWTLEGSADLPEIELKVDSFSITARSRKLKASWTPELGQDLNAYHNLDAEVELTSMLSEQIGLEIDQEILNDIVKGATASTKYWSRRSGKFVNRDTGADLGVGGNYSGPPDFTGNVSMWYETLVETINDVSANIHRKTLRGGANFLVCGPEVANILEFTSGFRASVTATDEKGSIGAVKVGDLNKKWDVIVHPYFYRNVILVGRKGSSFLESGYVYAPYVPLQSTPTIFDPTTFVPRKAVMTRYGKAMVRPDMYGLVVIQDLLG